jgi:hypothetical protein
VLRNQITDPQRQWVGSVPDDYLLHNAGSAVGLIETLCASFAHPKSKFHGDQTLLDRILLAAAFLDRSQNREGNIDLLSTNFNSPPDTGFVVHNVATAAALGVPPSRKLISMASRVTYRNWAALRRKATFEFNDTLWPEYLEMQAALHSYLNEVTERIIREEVYRDAADAKERAG